MKKNVKFLMKIMLILNLVFSMCFLVNADEGDLKWKEVNGFSGGESISSVATDGKIFVAVGSDGLILTSTDKVNWEIQNSPAYNYLHEVCFFNGKFYAYGTERVVFISEDGYNWKKEEINIDITEIDSITIKDNVMVVQAHEVMFTSSNQNYIFYSNDGVNFTSISKELELEYIYNGSGSIGVIDDEIYFLRSSPYKEEYFLFKTKNGSNWEKGAINSKEEYDNLSKQLFRQEFSIEDCDFSGVDVLNDNYLGEDYEGRLGGIWDKDRKEFILCGYDYILTSPDGETWSKISTDETLEGIIKANNNYYAIANKKILKSGNLKDWEIVFEDKESDYGFSKIEYNGKFFAAIGNYGLLATSENGDKWGKVNTKIDDELYSIACNKDSMVISGSKNAIITLKSNKDYYINKLEDFYNGCLNAFWDGKKYIIVSSENIILTSKDGFSWEKHSTDEYFYRVDFKKIGDTIFALQGEPFQDKMYTSKDGLNWKRQTLPTGNTLFSGVSFIVANDEKIILAGYEMLITDNVFGQVLDPTIDNQTGSNDDDVKIWDLKTTDNPMKEWTIKFNNVLNEESVNINNIYVKDYQGNKVEGIKLSLENDKKTVKITTNNPYQTEKKYYIYINTGIKSQNGKALKNNTEMAFQVIKQSQEENKEIYFPDKNLEAAIRERINKPTGSIHISDVSKIYTLDGMRKNISNLEGIQYLNNLTCLYLGDNEISDITPLKNLTKLDYLEIKNNKISDIAPLKDLSNLSNLQLENNRISDITSLENLTKLKVLLLNNNEIDNISSLKNFSNLEILQLNYNRISDISPLKNRTNLIFLQLNNNQISDINALENLTNLTELQLSNNKISTITPLKNLTKLEILYLSNNKISDFSPVSKYYNNIVLTDFQLKP